MKKKAQSSIRKSQTRRQKTKGRSAGEIQNKKFETNSKSEIRNSKQRRARVAIPIDATAAVSVAPPKKGLRVLIAAGPTREYIDDVRYLSNASSGRMGAALAQAAWVAGHRITLIVGPGEFAPPNVEPPPCELLIPVVSAEEMHRAVIRHAQDVDAVIMAAAVADYRPARRIRGKMKKTGKELLLRLVPTPDILAELGRQKGRRVLVGFALEAQDARANALRKLREKHLDMIVVNSPAAMSAERATVELLFASGHTEEMPDTSKAVIADRIVAALREMTPGKRVV